MKGTLTANTGILNGAIQPPTNQTPAPWGTYCWSHGICNHTSATCKYPANGHSKKATLTNVMGGRLLMSKPPGYKAIFVPKPSGRGKDKEGNTPTPNPPQALESEGRLASPVVK
jgi:hypothetical protein